MLFKGGFGLAAQTLRDAGSTMLVQGSMAKVFKKAKQSVQKILTRNNKFKVEANQTQRLEKCKSNFPNEQQLVLVDKSPFARYVQKFAVQSLASQLRRRAAMQFRNGRHFPIFAFVSMGLASQTQQNKDVSDDIRVPTFNSYNVNSSKKGFIV